MELTRGKLSVLSLMFLTMPLFAGGECVWQENGVCICEETFSGGTHPLDIVSDSCGGAIVVWADNRGGYERICAQRVDSCGNILWDTDGVIITTDGIELIALEPYAVSDDNSGVIVTWSYFGGIYAQRVDSTGQTLWGDNGIVVRYPMGGDSIADYPSIVADGQGGEIIGWVENYYPGPIYWFLYLQRIDNDGTPMWGSHGFLVTSETSAHYPAMVSDQKGGLVINWGDYGNEDCDMYAQHIDSLARETWDSGGVPICTTYGIQAGGPISSIGKEEWVIVWVDTRNVDWDIYSQKISSDGTSQWTINGNPVCTASHRQWGVKLATDENGYIIFCWTDERSGTYYEIYAQRVDTTGVFLWDYNGTYISTMADTTVERTRLRLKIVEDKKGGIILAWKDHRYDNWDIYSQRVDMNGVLQWGIEDLPVCTTMEDQYWGPVITTDGSGGAIIAWGDLRGSSNVYVQRVIDVEEGIEEDRFTEGTNIFSIFSMTNPCSNPVIKYSVGKASRISLKVFDITGRLIETLVDEIQDRGYYTIMYETSTLTSGIYFLNINMEDFSSTKKFLVIK